MDIRSKKLHYHKSLRSWVLFDFGLPVLIIVIIWPINHFLIGATHAFERVFSAADLIPIGSVLMLAVSREIEAESNLKRIGRDMDWFKQVGLLISIVALIVYMALKYYSMAYVFPSGKNGELDAAMKGAPYLCFLIIMCAFSFCFAAKKTMIANLAEVNKKDVEKND